MRKGVKCYLIADEVGLGKTRIAKAIIDHMAYNETYIKFGGLKVIYIASNERIARQNLSKGSDFHKTPDIGLDNLAIFQRKTVEHTLEVLGLRKIEQSDKDGLSKDYNEDNTFRDRIRLSMLHTSKEIEKLNKKHPDSLNFSILGLSPATTFTNLGSKCGDSKERENISKKYKELIKYISDGDNSDDIQLDSLKASFEHDFNKISEAIISEIEIFMTTFKSKILEYKGHKSHIKINNSIIRMENEVIHDIYKLIQKSVPEELKYKDFKKEEIDLYDENNLRKKIIEELVTSSSILRINIDNELINPIHYWNKYKKDRGNRSIFKTMIDLFDENDSEEKRFEIVKEEIFKKLIQFECDLYEKLMNEYENDKTNTEIKSRFSFIFQKARKRLNDMNILWYNPDIIIMDEFQRFRELLDKEENNKGYKLLEMVDTINKNRDKHGQPQVKILLLSATPYKLRKNDLTTSDDLDESNFSDEEPEVSENNAQDTKKLGPDTIKNKIDDEEIEYGEENPFDDFTSLLRFINQLNGNDDDFGVNNVEDQYNSILCRTERRDYYTLEEASDIFIQIDLSSIASKDELDLIKYKVDEIKRLKENFPGDRNSFHSLYDTYHEEAPEFYLFASRYSSVVKSSNESILGLEEVEKRLKNVSSKDLLIKEKDGHLFIDPSVIKGHLRTRLLIENALPQGFELRLWLRPTKDSDDANWLGKTLCFTHYEMSTRAVAAIVSAVAEQRLRDLCENGRMVYNEEKYEQNDSCVPEHLEEYIGVILHRLFGYKEEEDVKKLSNAFTCFFQVPYAVLVMRAFTGKEAGEINEKDYVRYCYKYKLEDVLGEYYELYKKNKKDKEDKKIPSEFLNNLCKLLKSYKQRTKITIFPDFIDDNKYSCSMGERYTKDRTDSKSHESDHEEMIEKIFNSPFYPFVLAITSTGQEGLNLQKYCNQIMHWSVARGTDAFEQREGRIDRPDSLSNRQKLIAMCKDKEVEIEDLSWDDIKKRVSEMVTDCSLAKEAGLYPTWYIPSIAGVTDKFKIRRIIPVAKYDSNTIEYRTLYHAINQYPSFGIKKAEETLSPFKKELNNNINI
ncbi:MAG: hypothetical protein GX306_11785 [Clostridiales bacterium]|nr:hypothetical protein [Clostridiales bacterium]